MTHKILISHEVPLNYLEFSKQFNDYDYALVHLFPDNPEYLEFFKRSVREGRRVMLDNSAYEISVHKELKEKYPQGYFPMDEYARYIEALQPSDYVLPDVKDSCEGTIRVVEEWIAKYGYLSGRKIGVVHGKTVEEMQACYDYLAKVCDKLAFSFESWWFDFAKNEDIPLEEIRYRILCYLQVDESKPHHLLGCILPQEFKLWKDVAWVESIDTSAPITNALEDIILDENTQYKPKTTIHDAFTKRFNRGTAELILINVKKFKTFIQ